MRKNKFRLVEHREAPVCPAKDALEPKAADCVVIRESPGKVAREKHVGLGIGSRRTPMITRRRKPHGTSFRFTARRLKEAGKIATAARRFVSLSIPS
jgi:hypothetical protein